MLRTVQTAYRNSAYFLYYDYLFEPLFKKKYIFLKDLQLDSIQTCLKILQVNKQIIWQEHDNISEVIEVPCKNSDKMPDLISLKPYSHTFGSVFVANLSIIDLIFCKGPQSFDFFTNK